MKIIYSFLAFIFSFTVFSQNFSLSVPNQGQTVYVEINNRIKCVVEGISCNSILLTTDNGVLVKEGPCQYIYRPSTVSNSKITIFKKINNKFIKIGEEPIKIRNLPPPTAFVAGCYDDTVKKSQLKIQVGVMADYSPYFGVHTNFQIKNCALTIIRNKNLLFFTSMEGHLFSEEIKEQLGKLQKGDIVIISSVTVTTQRGIDALANAKEYFIE